MEIFEEAANTKEKHLRISPLNAPQFIKVNELEEIDDPIFFARSNMPTEKGLLSNEIFGITKEDRTTIFAYIHLAGETFMHPLAYKIWSKLDSNIPSCIGEIDTFKLDKETGKLVSDPNGENGIKFLQKIIKTINFKNNKSAKRLVKTTFLEKYREKLFIDDFIVIPAGYRDVDTESSGNIGVGEINKMYNAIIRDCKALKESDDYGLSLNGSLRLRIQKNIVAVYDFICFGRDTKGVDSQASGLSRKLGLIRRAGMKKSFDWGARLVICTQNLRKENLSDILIDLDSIGLPLAAICANYYPYMIFWIRTWFENNLTDKEDILVVDPKKKSAVRGELQDWREYYSDERIKQELDRFLHGSSTRLNAIEAPVSDEYKRKNTKAYLMFKGYMVPDEAVANQYEKQDSPIADEEYMKFSIQERPLTWCDLFYRAAMDVTKDRTVLVSRFPIDSYYNQYPAKVKVVSTNETEPMIINGTFFKLYPKIRIEDINQDTSNKFVDVALPNNVRLDSIGGDFDGDTVSSKAVYSIESNDELLKAINSKKHYISLGGENIMYTSKECIQSLYNLTLVLPENKSSLTEAKF